MPSPGFELRQHGTVTNHSTVWVAEMWNSVVVWVSILVGGEDLICGRVDEDNVKSGNVKENSLSTLLKRNSPST
ncbi:hypothetical protein TNCV_3778571 [Trichonephila clavipes]|nr:hypothetical protein TNCV_3778571 [Trichonephila clavipes]